MGAASDQTPAMEAAAQAAPVSAAQAEPEANGAAPPLGGAAASAPPQDANGAAVGDPSAPSSSGALEQKGAVAQAMAPGKLSPAEDAALLKEFFMDMKDVDRENEVMRIIGAFKLNPFEQLGLRFDATAEDVRRQFRKVSLMVHPDKCKHPQGQVAFEIIQQAAQQLESDQRIKDLRHVLTMAQDQVVKEWKKKTKNDPAVRLAAVLHKDGQKGVEAQFRESSEFHETWKEKSRDLLARAEFRKRKITQRLTEETERLEVDEAENRKKAKAAREHHQKWEGTREGRVGTWRDFQTKKKGVKTGKEALGGVKPPKQKTWDEDKTYVQRPVGEQYAPAPIAQKNRSNRSYFADQDKKK